MPLSPRRHTSCSTTNFVLMSTSEKYKREDSHIARDDARFSGRAIKDKRERDSLDEHFGVPDGLPKGVYRYIRLSRRRETGRSGSSPWERMRHRERSSQHIPQNAKKLAKDAKLNISKSGGYKFRYKVEIEREDVFLLRMVAAEPY